MKARFEEGKSQKWVGDKLREAGYKGEPGEPLPAILKEMDSLNSFGIKRTISKTPGGKPARGRPCKINREELDVSKLVFFGEGKDSFIGDGEKSLRTIINRHYATYTMVVVAQDYKQSLLDAGEPEPKKDPNKAHLGEEELKYANVCWPFSFPPLGKRLHYSLLTELGRLESTSLIIGRLNRLEDLKFWYPKLTIKEAIDYLRRARLLKEGEDYQFDDILVELGAF